MIDKKQISFWKAFYPKSLICFKEGYSFQIFKKDLIAGMTVGVVALPLAMAFAIASGVSPIQGLYTAIIAGFLGSLLGGSKLQISGPTGAFVVIVYGVIQRQGYEGLVYATIMAGILLIAMGLFRLGSLIKFVPYPLVTGFTAGIAVVIFSSQVKDFLGLQLSTVPADFISKWKAYFGALSTWTPKAFFLGLGTLGSIVALRRFLPKVPWGIFSIVGATLVVWLFHFDVETIGSRFGTLSRVFPTPSLPSFSFDFQTFQNLIPEAITIALLAGVESLLSAVVADGMSGSRHKPDCELVAQGFANIGAMFFGGIPATGAIARTAVNVKTGGKTPVAGMIHAVTLLIFIFLCAPLVALIPLAALSAVLMVVAWNMSEVNQLRHLFKAPLGDIAILGCSLLLTVFVDLTVAVEVGLVLTAFLFMKKMSSLSNVVAPSSIQDEDLLEQLDPDALAKKEVPSSVRVYEMNGPFFFGVVDQFKDVFHGIESPPRVFILRMRRVPVIDATGIHALKQFFHQCQKDETTLILSGITGQPAKSLKKYGMEEVLGTNNIFPHLDAALKRAREVIHESAIGPAV